MNNPGENKNKTIQIWGLNIIDINYNELAETICETIKSKKKLLITYSNANTLNKIYKKPGVRAELNKFDIVHPDGVGVFLASRLLSQKNKIKKRFNGSDLYPLLAELFSKENTPVFFFGHDDTTLQKIFTRYTDLNICGYQEGYNFNNNSLITKLNSSKPVVLIVGLGQFRQERWILENKDNIGANVIIAVGDGIKVFADTKLRGPIFIRKIGLEWLVRLSTNPLKYWSRYILGIPLFLVRIIFSKLTKLSNN